MGDYDAKSACNRGLAVMEETFCIPLSLKLI